MSKRSPLVSRSSYLAEVPYRPVPQPRRRKTFAFHLALWAGKVLRNVAIVLGIALLMVVGFFVAANIYPEPSPYKKTVQVTVSHPYQTLLGLAEARCPGVPPNKLRSDVLKLNQASRLAVYVGETVKIYQC